jgi:hypothetical protein
VKVFLLFIGQKYEKNQYIGFSGGRSAPLPRATDIVPLRETNADYLMRQWPQKFIAYVWSA